MNKKQKLLFAERLSNAGCKEHTVMKIMELLEGCLAKAESKPVRKRLPNLLTLEEWEAKEGCTLNYSMVASWAQGKRYDPKIILQLVDEFRVDMLSKGSRYADFKMAFQNYFNKGYLSVKPSDPKVMLVSSDGVSINRRGGGI